MQRNKSTGSIVLLHLLPAAAQVLAARKVLRDTVESLIRETREKEARAAAATAAGNGNGATAHTNGADALADGAAGVCSAAGAYVFEAWYCLNLNRTCEHT